jgi:hypothetical protein
VGLTTLNQKQQEFTRELEHLTTISAKLAGYINYYAITPMNDAVQAMLQMQIDNLRGEKGKENVIKRLQDDLEQYKQEKEVFDKHLKAAEGKAYTFDLEEVTNLFKELYTLKHSGPILLKLMEGVDSSFQPATSHKPQTDQTGGAYSC